MEIFMKMFNLHLGISQLLIIEIVRAYAYYTNQVFSLIWHLHCIFIF